jgi:hypothetical protein
LGASGTRLLHEVRDVVDAILHDDRLLRLGRLAVLLSLSLLQQALLQGEEQGERLERQAEILR